MISLKSLLVATGIICATPAATGNGKIQTIETLLREGQSAIAVKTFTLGSKKCNEGILLLGNDYFSVEVLDDSGLKLIAGQLQEQKGNFESSSVIYCRILDSRLQLLKQKLKK